MLVVAFQRRAGLVVGGPGIEACQVDEVFPQLAQCLLRALLAQTAEKLVVVHGTALHELQQALHSRLVLLVS
ncbi:hypothetical protein D3C85_1898260 [compost metagenome]